MICLQRRAKCVQRDRRGDMVDLTVLPKNGLAGNYVIWRKKEGKEFALQTEESQHKLITKFIVKNTLGVSPVDASLCMLDRIRPYAAYPIHLGDKRKVGFVVGQFFLLIDFHMLTGKGWREELRKRRNDGLDFSGNSCGWRLDYGLQFFFISSGWHYFLVKNCFCHPIHLLLNLLFSTLEEKRPTDLDYQYNLGFLHFLSMVDFPSLIILDHRMSSNYLQFYTQWCWVPKYKASFQTVIFLSMVDFPST